MSFPPPVLPIDRTNTTPQLDTHPADHNAVNAAVNDIVVEMQTRTGFSAYTTGFSVPVSADTFIPWQNVNFDTPPTWVSAQPHVLICPVEGIYAIQFKYQWTGPFGQQTIPAIWLQGIKWTGPGETGASNSHSMTTGLGPGYQVAFTVYNANTGAISVSPDVSIVRVQI